MDLLVLFPLEFLGNSFVSKPVLDGNTGVAKLRPAKGSAAEENLEDASGELGMKAKLQFEFTKIPSLLTLKPN